MYWYAPCIPLAPPLVKRSSTDERTPPPPLPAMREATRPFFVTFVLSPFRKWKWAEPREGTFFPPPFFSFPVGENGKGRRARLSGVPFFIELKLEGGGTPAFLPLLPLSGEERTVSLPSWTPLLHPEEEGKGESQSLLTLTPLFPPFLIR